MHSIGLRNRLEVLSWPTQNYSSQVAEKRGRRCVIYHVCIGESWSKDCNKNTGSNPVLTTNRELEKLVSRWAHNPKNVSSSLTLATTTSRTNGRVKVPLPGIFS
jgi:hypothetical protein